MTEPKDDQMEAAAQLRYMLPKCSVQLIRSIYSGENTHVPKQEAWSCFVFSGERGTCKTSHSGSAMLAAAFGDTLDQVVLEATEQVGAGFCRCQSCQRVRDTIKGAA